MKPKIPLLVLRDMTAVTSTTATTTTAATQEKIPNWRVIGDWFDVCKCSVPVSLHKLRLMATAMVF